MVLQTAFNKNPTMRSASSPFKDGQRNRNERYRTHEKERNCKLGQRSNTEKFSATPVSRTAEIRQRITRELDAVMLADKISLAEIEEHLTSLKCDRTNAETSKTTVIPNGNCCNADIDVSPLQVKDNQQVQESIDWEIAHTKKLKELDREQELWQTDRANRPVIKVVKNKKNSTMTSAVKPYSISSDEIAAYNKHVDQYTQDMRRKQGKQKVPKK